MLVSYCFSLAASGPGIPGVDRFEGKGIHYFIKDPETFRGRRVVIAGGGEGCDVMGLRGGVG